MKTCTKCKITKELSEYYFRKDNNKYREVCKDCFNVSMKNKRDSNIEYYREKARDDYYNNKEKHQKSSKKYREENKEELAVKNKAYRKKNKIELERKHKIYRVKNRDKICKRMRIYSKKNMDSSRFHGSLRRAKKLSSSDGSITKSGLISLREKQNYKCYSCGNHLDFNSKNKVHLDHHIPLSKGGTHTLGNVVYLCKHCNVTKHNKMPETFLLI